LVSLGVDYPPFYSLTKCLTVNDFDADSSYAYVLYPERNRFYYSHSTGNLNEMEKERILKELGEFGLHHRIQDILGAPSAEVIVGIGDDAAVFQPRNQPIVITKDAMVEDIHFRLQWTTAADLAFKALASNISDLACKGARPAYGLIAIGLPGETTVAWIEEFYQTLAELRERWGLEIIGGDTVRSPKILVSITAIGYQIPKEPIRIGTARPGDWILATGWLGDAAAGLDLLEKGEYNPSDLHQIFLIDRFLRPDPRLKEAHRILELARPSSMTDVSDGLARDLPKICSASSVGARVDADLLPRSEALRAFSAESAAYAWKGGEDYELLFTVSPSQADRLLNAWDNPDCPLTPIGEIISAEEGIRLVNWEGPEAPGYDHFR
jgi:thiamine-monophosphate kinase